MIALELVALLIVVAFVLIRARTGPEPKRFLVRLALLVVASWVVENSVIHAYHFYVYNPDWTLFIHHVPLAIVLIWPVVIHSAWELAGYLLGERKRHLVPLVGGLLVLADASLIEPIAVNSGLWHWTEPGVFDVPPIGIIGWAYYAALCMVIFERDHLFDAVAIVIAPLGTHLLLLASWWGLFRWINQPLSPWPFVALAWLVSLSSAALSLRSGARMRVPPQDMLNRVPAALFFFVLLALDGRSETALVAYALAFAPPYVTVTRLPRWRPFPTGAAE